MSPLAHLEANFERLVADLAEFARIPSVSTDPARRGDVRRAAEWAAARLGQAGLPDARVLETAGHPVVLAGWRGRPGAPTVLVYGHYDVQPPEPLERWVSPPFEPTLRDGRLYARGVSDDKGPILVPIAVVEAFFATGDGPPVNLVFLLEGEEEVGSPSLEPFVAAHAADLAADLVLSADGAMWRPDRYSLNLSSRGLVSLELTLTGPSKDLHSGRHGGAVMNPLHAMALLVASLHDDSGRVAVPGFYDRVRELSPDERAAIAALPWSDPEYLAETGAPELFGEPGYSSLERQWTRPTLELNGLWGGYTGPGGKTVVPSEAHAKISCRLVPGQEPAEVLERLRDHLERHRPPGVRLELEARDHGARAYTLEPDHPGLDAARRALGELSGEAPLEVRMGGTLPVAEVLERVLGLKTVFLSFSTADEDFHAPNEFFRLSRFRDGLRVWARALELLGAG